MTAPRVTTVVRVPKQTNLRCSLPAPPRSKLTTSLLSDVPARIRATAARTRGLRVLIMLIGIWAMSTCDYIYTLNATDVGLTREINPLAAQVLDLGAGPLLIFKASLVGLGSAGLLVHRRRRLSEAATFIVLLALAIVLIRWQAIHDLNDFIEATCPPNYYAW